MFLSIVVNVGEPPTIHRSKTVPPSVPIVRTPAMAKLEKRARKEVRKELSPVKEDNEKLTMHIV